MTWHSTGATTTDAAVQTDAPQALLTLVQEAVKARASDIHLQLRGAEAEVAFRLDGVLTTITTLPAPLAERVVGRIKFLARLKTYQDSLPQDGRIERAELNSSYDLRVATYPTVTGEKIVIRLFNVSAAHTIQELGIPDSAHAELESFLRQTSGLLLLTGPAGSGKTTTIYACLRHLAELGGRHIITVEDPVEQIIPGIMQTEINEAIGLDFARAARHLLRQDPQVLVLGEIRDEATAQLAVRAGLTGHLVVSTLHAGSCQGVLERLLTLCPDHSAVAAALELIVNQRLLRQLCSHCGGHQCEKCFQTGYSGRIPVMECLRLTDAHRALVRTGAFATIQPPRPLVLGARDLLQQGRSNQAELQRVLGL
jgi:type II secretory ATPase GspE/PulE/Tfp pilus assembly ATPase PilB-like protein